MWISDAAKSRLDLGWLLDSLHTVGEAGNRAKAKIRLYGPGEEALLTRRHQDLLILMDLVRSGRDLSLVRALRGLVHLSALDLPWGPVELGAIAQILSSLLSLEEIVIQEGLSWRLGFDPRPALEILRPHTRGGGFKVDDSNDPSLRDARRKARELDRELRERIRSFRNDLERSTGIPGYRFAQDIVVDLADRETIQRLRATEGLVEVESNPSFVRFRENPPRELKELRTSRDLARRAVREMEEVRISEIASRLKPSMKGIERALAVAGDVDLALAQARFSLDHGWCIPSFGKGLRIEKGVNPLVRDAVERQGGTYVPADVAVTGPSVVVVGSNMGGKTVLLRTMGMLQLMVQTGMLPTARAMTTRLYGSIAWVGAAGDALDKGLSSYGLEIVHLREALEGEEPRLILLDEFARSTSAEEGLAMAHALIDHLSGSDGLFVFAGHLHSLADRSDVDALLIGGIDETRYRELLAQGHSPEQAIRLSTDYTVRPYGGSAWSDAITIARLLGLPEPIVQGALRRLGNLNPKE